MNTYVYILKLTERLYDEEAWTKEEHDLLNQHYLRLKKDYESGIVIHVGRTVDPTEVGFGMVIYKANNTEEAKQYMLDDPAVKHHLMTASYHEYKVVFSSSNI